MEGVISGDGGIGPLSRGEQKGEKPRHPGFPRGPPPWY